MVVSSFAKMVFQAHQEFAEQWRKTHSGDEVCPQYTITKIFDKYCKEFYDDIFNTKSRRIVSESEYSEEDQRRIKAARALQKQYQKEENIFVIDYLLENGAYWDDIYKYCSNNRLLEVLEARAQICDAMPHQCSFLCKFFTEKGCAKNEFSKGERSPQD